ncbi:helix-turn-helix transcriptional regulator [Sutterella megalosphaeroides]
MQFRKRVRLYEARKLLLSHRMNVAGSSFAVGYESSS